MRISDWSSDVCSSDLQRLAWSSGRNALLFGRMGNCIHDRAHFAAILIGVRLQRCIFAYLYRSMSKHDGLKCRVAGLGVHCIADHACERLNETELQRCVRRHFRSEENTSELQSLMPISYAVFCLKKKNQ